MKYLEIKHIVLSVSYFIFLQLKKKVQKYERIEVFLQTKSFKVESDPFHILSYREFFPLFLGSEVPSNTLEMRKAASRKLSLLFFFILYLLLSFSQLGLGKWSSKELEKQEEAEGKWEVVEEDGSIIGSRDVARALPLEEVKKGSWKKTPAVGVVRSERPPTPSPTWQMNCQKKPTTDKCQCRKRQHSEFSAALRLS